jgi:hypothetical protein
LINAPKCPLASDFFIISPYGQERRAWNFGKPCRKRGQLLRNSPRLCGGHKKMSEKIEEVLHVEEKTLPF